MKKTGTVRRWDAVRGFGFINSIESHADVFFHVQDFQKVGDALPSEGLKVSFEEIHIGGKGPRAMAVRPLVLPQAASAATRQSLPQRGVPRSRSQPGNLRSQPSAQRWVLFLVPLWLVAWGYGVALQRLPFGLIGAIAGINVLTFFIYAFDKSAAENGRWRTQEKTLHLLALAGGWPAAWVAQQALRHKSNKVSFQTTYAVTVLLHLAVLTGWIFWAAPRLMP